MIDSIIIDLIFANYLDSQENLQLLCYNCYYLYVGEVLTGNQIRSIESNQETKQVDFDWQLDEDQIANMKALGLWEEDEPEENSLIARNK